MAKLSLSEIKGLTGLDHRRITRALSDLTPEDGPKGAKLYESSEALPLIYTGDNLDPNKERARLTHHQANIAALDELIKRGDLLSRPDVVAEVTEALANMRAKLLNLPPKVAPIIAGIDDVYEAQAALEVEVLEVIAELHTQYVDNEGSGESPDTAAAA